MAEEDDEKRQERRRAEAEEMARLQEQINNLPVSEHVLYMMHSLSALAVDRLGLAPEGAARKDVQQARLAIDAFKALLEVLEEARPTEEIAAHRGVLAQLQLAYVGALSGSAPVEQPPAQAEAEPEPPMPEGQPEPASESASETETEPRTKPGPKTKPKKTAKSTGDGKGDGAAGMARPAPKSDNKGS